MGSANTVSFVAATATLGRVWHKVQNMTPSAGSADIAAAIGDAIAVYLALCRFALSNNSDDLIVKLSILENKGGAPKKPLNEVFAEVCNGVYPSLEFHRFADRKIEPREDDFGAPVSKASKAAAAASAGSNSHESSTQQQSPIRKDRNEADKEPDARDIAVMLLKSSSKKVKDGHCYFCDVQHSFKTCTKFERAAQKIQPECNAYTVKRRYVEEYGKKYKITGLKL
jgi:hypothetical protein